MMNSSQDMRPVIIGVGQCVHKPEDPGEAKKSLDLVEIAVETAEEDSGVSGLSEKIDSLCLVNMLSGSYLDPCGELAQRLGAKPRSSAYTWIGATAPQWFVNRSAENIVSGQARIVLICGGEAFYSKKLREGSWDWDFPQKESWMVGDLRDPVSNLEQKYGLVLPLHFYPLMENALRFHEGLTLEEQRRELGDFLSRCSAIAAQNPYAWFKTPRTAEEIISPTGSNRMVAFPYTKLMCSIMEVDQAAAVFMTDERTARELGVPEGKWVYLLGAGDASDIWHVTERLNFYSSPSVKVAADKALEQAKIPLSGVGYLDFYSCFPCAPRITRNMLGIPKDDLRPLTVTGGMPYFGGPGNSYSLHAIARLVELLRQDPTKAGMIQALSWFISKHSVGVYSATPGQGPYRPVPSGDYQAELDSLRGPDIVDEASGRAEVETFMLLHDREGKPVSGVVVGRLDSRARFLARPVNDMAVLEAMTKEEVIGKRGKVRPRDGFNIFEF